ncbi:MAG: winged helix-turn-helix transcriptional regulator [Solirubrobacteraceae bacterium]
MEVTIPVAPPPKRHPYDQWAPDARALDLVGDKWTLLIIRDLVAGPRRFVELQRVLPGISTEQLRSRLNRMVADGLLTRQRFREVPPRVDYELTERSRELLPIIGELARWGLHWAWSAPKSGESVDIGAIFRSAPGLLRLPSTLRGSLDLVVGSARDARTYNLRVSRGHVKLVEERGDSEPTATQANATVRGSFDAWIKALGPNRATGGLRRSGDSRLIDGVLDGLSDAPPGASAASAHSVG